MFTLACGFPHYKCLNKNNRNGKHIILCAMRHPKHLIFSAAAYHSTIREVMYCYMHFTKEEKGGRAMVRLLLKIIELVTLELVLGPRKTPLNHCIFLMTEGHSV